MVIRGSVRSGIGKAAPAFNTERMADALRIVGWEPYPGTLNVRVSGSLKEVVGALPPPVALTEHHKKRLGPLRWWPATMTSADLPRAVECALIRHARTRTGYLEMAAPVGLRDLGLENGSQVKVTIHNTREP